MKTWIVILKILAAIAAIAGIIYIIAAYGDKIVAFARKLLGRKRDYICEDCDDFDFEDDLDETIAADDDFEG